MTAALSKSDITREALLIQSADESLPPFPCTRRHAFCGWQNRSVATCLGKVKTGRFCCKAFSVIAYQRRCDTTQCFVQLVAQIDAPLQNKFHEGCIHFPTVQEILNRVFKRSVIVAKSSLDSTFAKRLWQRNTDAARHVHSRYVTPGIFYAACVVTTLRDSCTTR